jgi:hypothetical protein
MVYSRNETSPTSLNMNAAATDVIDLTLSSDEDGSDGGRLPPKQLTAENQHQPRPTQGNRKRAAASSDDDSEKDEILSTSSPPSASPAKMKTNEEDKRDGPDGATRWSDKRQRRTQQSTRGASNDKRNSPTPAAAAVSGESGGVLNVPLPSSAATARADFKEGVSQDAAASSQAVTQIRDGEFLQRSIEG